MLRTAIRGAFTGLLVTVTLGVCLAQIPFFSPANASAKVIKLSGQVTVLKDSYPWAVAEGSIIQPQQLIATGPDGYAQFQVTDGSTFEVFPNSKVIFRPSAGNLKDLVDMIVGKIRVHIEKLGGQPNPNNVKTPSAVISVRGTIFDVQVDEDDTTIVAVSEGLVAVRHAIKPSKTERLVEPGQVLTVYKNESLAKSTIDRGVIIDRVYHGITDAVITIMRGGGGARPGTPGGGGTTAGPGLPGDTKGNPPPPPAPTSAPPAPSSAPPNNN